MQSQIKVTPLVLDVANKIEGDGLEFVNNAVKWVNSQVSVRDYNDSSKEHEKQIRWKRTADQILGDNYVYKGKACTDLVIVFQALCEAKGYQTRFVKVNGSKGIHSLAEVFVNRQWYVVDVAGGAGIKKGRIEPGETFGGWSLWKRGGDAWDLGLVGYESMAKIR